MPYKEFTLRQVVEDFSLRIVEGATFIPELEPVEPSTLLQETLADGLPWAIAVGSEKARSEAVITPILLEVRRQLDRRVSVFSGEDFTVDVEAELSGRCDFLVSKSAEQLFIKAPAVIIVEAKKEDTKPGLGQCVAEMIAAQRFNAAAKEAIPVIYGCVTSGTAWRFLKLEGQTVTIDLADYPVPPVDQLLSILLWMLRSES
ncbi:hypothetical protein IQ266_18625 [filamentous cyanobacterium LEGE 11480]|uniref:Type I restriction enzyme R protein N-terminal domain-containing protein n=1 Tax=Romeriopsis navalis LEGE 11480 TaxID=2777977 RepID=A0A928VQ81_9CYAN|nr:hypothetical protein [Romeriopsis navalis]MBE9031752.1 hypothetical protein [Romeriopsis navalis LEGE 11480]